MGFHCRSNPGEDHVTGIRVVNVKTGEKRVINLDGIFIAIGVRPNSELIKGIITMSEAGYVLTNDSMKPIYLVCLLPVTSGEAAVALITAAADGAIAAYSAQKYIIRTFGE